MPGRYISHSSVIFNWALRLLGCTWLMLIAAQALAGTSGNTRLLILCYHDVPQKVQHDKYGVDQKLFVQQLEYLKTHGYHFVGMEDILQANKGLKELPEKAVLLTFDDAYESFYTFVFPILQVYRYPSVLSVVTSWIDAPPEGLPAKLMSWEQIAEVGRSNLVEIASHTHDLHKAIAYNPYGNTGWAAVSRQYNPSLNTYETEETFRHRIKNDVITSLFLLKAKAGIDAKVLTWPYGKWNWVAMEAAQDAGIQAAFDVADVPADAHSLVSLARSMVVDNPSIKNFIKTLKLGFQDPVRKRVVQIDLDTIYDPDAQQMEHNLDALIERLYTMKVSTVYLQAFCDDQGTGNIASVYFPNRVLPMKADLFNRVVNQLAIRDMEVYAWMPMVSIVLPDTARNEALRVREWGKDGIGLSQSWYARLTPFSEETASLLGMLYEDMALNARIDGVVFLDDGYLSAEEDFHPAALEVYRNITGSAATPPWELDRETYDRWTEAKISALNTLTEKLVAAVRTYRPRAQSARTLYAAAITNPGEGRRSFSQDYAQSLAQYDYVNIMAYPYMEQVSRPTAWLLNMVTQAKAYPDGLAKTIFKLQAYDWRRERWVSTSQLAEWLRKMVARGARHIGYYPDNCIDNMPKQKIIRTIMSTEDFPFTQRGDGAY